MQPNPQTVMDEIGEPLPLIRLEIENFKRLDVLRIEPNGKPVVRLEGKNAVGKSTAIDALEAVIGGKKASPERPIKKGARSARIVAEFDNLVVTRSFTPKGSYLEVTWKGEKTGSPQELVDALFGKISRDPLAHARLDARGMKNALMQIVGLDFTTLDRSRAEFYTERTVIGRLRDQVASQVASMPHSGQIPKPIDVGPLKAEYEEKKKAVEERKQLEDEQKRLSQEIAGIQREYEAQDRELVRLNEQLANIQRAILEAEEKKSSLIESLAGAKKAHDSMQQALANFEIPDLSDVLARGKAANEHNVKIKAMRAENEARAKAAADQRAKQDEYDAFTQKIQNIDAEKARMLEEAKFPIQGLSFGEDDVLFNGLPLSQASQGERMRVCTAMMLAQHKASGLKTAPLLLIRDGSLLDEDNLRSIGEMVKAAGGLAMIERTTAGAEIKVVIQEVLEIEPTDVTIGEQVIKAEE